MKTRAQSYGQEAACLLRDITMYRVMTKEQVLRLYPGKREKVQNLLAYLVRQGRIWECEEYFCAAPECAEDIDRGLLAAVWVLADFIDRVEYHSVGDFPAKIIFSLTARSMRSSTRLRGRKPLSPIFSPTPANSRPSTLF